MGQCRYSLCQHQCDGPRSCSDIEHVFHIGSDWTCCTEENAISIYLHGRFLVAHFELLETENAHLYRVIYENAVTHKQRSVAHFGQVRVVCYDDDSLPEFVPQLEEEFMQFALCDAVQVS